MIDITEKCLREDARGYLSTARAWARNTDAQALFYAGENLGQAAEACRLLRSLGKNTEAEQREIDATEAEIEKNWGLQQNDNQSFS